MNALADLDARIARLAASFEATPLSVAALLLAAGFAMLLVLNTWTRKLEEKEKEG
jgi:hypothetical protein